MNKINMLRIPQLCSFEKKSEKNRLTKEDKKTEEYRILKERFNLIGWWKGPLADKELQAENREFWLKLGEQGAALLIELSWDQQHVDVLDGVASLLSDHGGKALAPMLDYLREPEDKSQEIVILTALQWMKIPEDSEFFTLFREAISERIKSDDYEIRELAYSATTAFPVAIAMEILKKALVTEKDKGMIEIIEDALAFDLSVLRFQRRFRPLQE